MHEHDRIRAEVRAAYGALAREPGNGCCQPQPVAIAADRLGYSREELDAAPAGSNLGLGCGNPQAIAALRPGETVLDLGSGAGFDCFLAARQVGPEGRVIGVDMTPEMVAKARANATGAGLHQVEFRLGEIEALPVADACIDAILSNCVINLSPDKARVFREAFRVLKPGGRLAISDVIATAELPEALRTDAYLYSCCIAGASPIAELEAALSAAGFAEVRIVPKDENREIVREWAPGSGVEDFVVSASIEAIKPLLRTQSNSQASAQHTGPDTDSAPPLHPAIVALVALSSNIAANHPKQGLCQVERLRELGVPEGQIHAAVEIARHIRDEAGQQLDARLDAQMAAQVDTQVDESTAAPPSSPSPPRPGGHTNSFPVAVSTAPCCTPTASGQSCC
jgi:arsenite methyltransferase